MRQLGSNTTICNLTMAYQPFDPNIAACILKSSSRSTCDADSMDGTFENTHNSEQDPHPDAQVVNNQTLAQILQQHITATHDPDGSQDGDEEDDRDSAMGSDGFPSETGSIAPEVTDYRWEHGRRWASDSWPPYEHYFPNDDNEMHRYGLVNEMIYLALSGRRYTAPLNERNVHHVLDVGCGM